MLLRTDVTGTRPVTQTDATTTLTSVTNASQEAFNRLALISVGKKFQAEIMSRLNDGTYLVRIANTTARMALPDSTQAGQTVAMTLVAANPRPTFLLGETSGAEGQSMAGTLLDAAPSNQVNKVVPATTEASNAALAEQIPSSATASLSTTGRLLDNLLHAAQLDGAPNKVLGQSAIISSPDVTPENMAYSLQNTLEHSGLFYESHLNQWINGKRTTEELMREPQASVLPNMNVAKADSSLIDMMRALDAAQHSGAPSTDSLSQAATLNNDTAHLISLQLGALEQRRVAWQGELWPGQKFEWDVSEETPKNDSSEPNPSWRSTVRFELPTLGVITASVHLANGHVQMQVRAETDATAATLRAHGSKLANALEAAGSPLDQLTVTKNAPA